MKAKSKTLRSYRRKVRRVLAQVRAKYNIKGTFTEADFYRICEGEKINLLRPQFPVDTYASIRKIYKKYACIKGFYITAKRLERFIYLRCFFYKINRFSLQTAFHELGHHFLEHKGNALLDNGNLKHSTSLHEIKADYFAELATEIKREVSK